MATALVLTGVDSVDTALAAHVDQRPDFLIGSLGELYESTRPKKGRGLILVRGIRCPVAGYTVTISGREDHLDSWRAACAAWWAAHPDVAPSAAPVVSFTVALSFTVAG